MIFLLFMFFFFRFLRISLNTNVLPSGIKATEQVIKDLTQILKGKKRVQHIITSVTVKIGRVKQNSIQQCIAFRTKVQANQPLLYHYLKAELYLFA